MTLEKTLCTQYVYTILGLLCFENNALQRRLTFHIALYVYFSGLFFRFEVTIKVFSPK